MLFHCGVLGNGRGLFGEHPDLLHPARGGLQHLKAEVAFLHNFAGERDVSGNLRDQATDGGGMPIL